MAFPDVDIARPIYPPPQILMNVQPSDDNPLVSSSCRAVTTGSRSRFAESPLWPCSSVLLEQPRPIAPLYDNIRSPMQLKFVTASNQDVLSSIEQIRQVRASGPQRARRGPSSSSGRLRGHPLHVSPNADLWAVGDPLNRLVTELRTACVVSGLCKSPPMSDIHYCFFLGYFVFRLLNLGCG
jgi:hypothetical protein